MEEMIARDYIVNEQPDVVVCVVDASNLERNLYLTVQLLELGVPVIVVLNMSDQAASRGLRIDTAVLSAELGAQVVATVGSRGVGMQELRRELAKIAGSGIATSASLHSASWQWEATKSCH
jgi:ferrous iron transport protein B